MEHISKVMSRVLNWFRPEEQGSEKTFAKVVAMRDLKPGDQVTGIASFMEPEGEILPLLPRTVKEVRLLHPGTFVMVLWDASPGQMYEGSRRAVVEPE